MVRKPFRRLFGRAFFIGLIADILVKGTYQPTNKCSVRHSCEGRNLDLLKRSFNTLSHEVMEIYCSLIRLIASFLNILTFGKNQQIPASRLKYRTGYAGMMHRTGW